MTVGTYTTSLDQIWRTPIMPPPRVPTLEWCQRNLIIPPETGTPWPGPYDVKNTPWVKGWYEVIDSPLTRLFAIQKGSQIAATQTCMNAVICKSVTDPGAVLYVMDSFDNVYELSKLRIKPIMAASTAIHAELRSASDEPDNLLYTFRRCFWRLIGSSSAGKASSFTHRYIVLEEPEKYPNTVGREGNVIESLIQRCKRVWNSLVLITCTPSTKAGFIAKYVDLGDRMVYLVPCPHCGTGVVLRFSTEFGVNPVPEHVPVASIVYDHELSPVEAARRARLICGKCSKPISDTQKRRMVDHGRWESTQEPKMTGYRSAVISGLYPKDESATVRSFVEKFLKTRDNPADLQVFINQDGGEVWEPPPKKSLSRKRIALVRDALRYPRGVIPTDKPFILFADCDVQAHHLPYAVWAMDKDSLWLIDDGSLSTVDDVTELHDTEYSLGVKQPDGTWAEDTSPERRTFRPERIFIDSRHRTMEVYNFCGQHPWACPIMGQDANRTQGTAIRFRETDKLPDGRPIVGNAIIKVAYLHPSMFKDQFAEAVETTLWPPDAPTPPPSRVKIYFHQQITADYMKQLYGEVLREGPENKFGEREMFWVRVHTNDQFDLAQYAFAIRHLAHNDLIRLTAKPKKKKEEPGTEQNAAAPAPQPQQPVAPAPKRRRLEPYVDPSVVKL